MSEVTIRQVQGDELAAITHPLLGYAFRASPPLPDRETWEKELLEYRRDATYVAVFEDGQSIAVAASSPMTQNVRGKIYPMGGVWGVATHPAGRRKGYARQLIHQLFGAMHEAGLPFSALYAFRESFYERLGYCAFPMPHFARFSPRALTPLLRIDLEGSIALMPIQEGFATFRAYMCERQSCIHGLALYGDKSASRLGDLNRFWLAAAQVEGETRGLMLYQLAGEPRCLSARTFLYSDSRGRYLLLEWLARHADQAERAELRLQPGELPETWMADLAPAISFATSVGGFEPPLARVINVAGIGGMSVGDGRFSAHIHDSQCPWNERCYTFESVGGKLRVSPASSADCDLSIQALTGLVYGTHNPDDFRIRGWGNPSAVVQSAMKALFPPMLPYLHETF